jgi:hypothetical protein
MPGPSVRPIVRRAALSLLGLDNVRIVEAGASDTAEVAEMAVPRRGDGSAAAGQAHPECPTRWGRGWSGWTACGPCWPSLVVS